MRHHNRRISKTTRHSVANPCGNGENGTYCCYARDYLDLAEVEENYRKSAVNSVREISTQQINGENYAETLYKKAVFARAKAELLQEFNTLSGREIHQNREYVSEQKSLLAEATHAIRTLKGKKRGSVWLL